jgi:hypothetical protein
VRLEIKQELDEPGFFRQVRVGNWIHTFDYETGQGDWTWRPDIKTLLSTSATTIASDARFSKLMDSAPTVELKTERKAILLERIAARHG